MGTGVAEKIEEGVDERIGLARSLVDYIEAGNDEKIIETIDKLTSLRDSHLFQEIGQLTRQLHDALGSCYSDKITSLASNEIPNARERLNYVIEKTEEAANRTLNAVDASLPMSAELEENAKQMTEEWERFRRREMNADDFRSLTQKISGFLETVNVSSSQLHVNLSEIMMAQEYQDLTGQMINQVINIVEEVEGNLVQLIKCEGAGVCETKEEGPDIKAEGPQISSADSQKVVSGQDDVDELLSSLGF